MNPSAQYAHARSNNPLFDQLIASRRSGRPPLTPITTSSRYADVSTRRRRTSQAALPSVESTTSVPFKTDNLSADEKAIVSEMGGTVARLILQMLDDDTASKRRWPFHEVK